MDKHVDEVIEQIDLDIAELDARLEMALVPVHTDWWIGGGSGPPPKSV